MDAASAFEALAETLGDGGLGALLGLPGGIILGLAARRARFCTLGALESAFYAEDYTGIRMWAVALGCAILGAFGLAAAGLFDPAASFHMQLQWNPLASIIGGLVFGYGMALAGNCGYGALARLGGGDLRAFVVVAVLGVSAAMTAGGPVAELRALAFPRVPVDPDAPLQGLAHALSALTGAGPLVFAALIAAAMLAWAFASAEFRAETGKWAWSGGAGAAIALGWALTSAQADANFEATAVVSHSYADPIGETILWLMTSSGGGGLGFGAGSVAGVWLGALIGSWEAGHFRWEACDDPQELQRQIIGAVLMGIGGVTALGCSVGQGLTAFSLLHWSAPVTLAAIAVGAALGLRQLIRGFHAV
ncbi:YeeE/YedE family protein [Rhodovulum sp. DZ06]|uniref:YeeE/YedE family protein n=1 Tax=Rhodovulum sp. DZ06 TaxID=3425126 RepID=UPI003D34156A